VIDYVIANEICVDKVKEFKVGEKVDSDHMPVTVKMRVEREEKKEEEERSAEMKTRIRWDDEARTFYKEKNGKGRMD